jgi:hypothetical protein
MAESFAIKIATITIQGLLYNSKGLPNEKTSNALAAKPELAVFHG